MTLHHLTTPCSYNCTAKQRFHSTGRRLLKEIAKLLEPTMGAYNIRSNQGGIAVSGEITLHHDRVYIQISQWFGDGAKILVRTVNGQHDYCGGPNHIINIEALKNLDRFAAIIKGVVQ